jgi:AraC family transcriptional regulator, ethanolamine operon transcriptional activator
MTWFGQGAVSGQPRLRSIGKPQNETAMGQSTITSQPPVTVVDISDLSAAIAGLDLIKQDGISLQSLPLQAKRVIVRLNSVTVVYHSTNLRVRTRAQTQKGLIACIAFGPRTSGTVQGFRVRPGMLVIAEPDAEVVFAADPGYESVALLVPPDELRTHCEARQRTGGFRWPHGVDVLRADPGGARQLFRLGKRLVAAASRTPAKFDEGRPERAAAQVELLEALLVTTRSVDPVEPAGTERTRRTHDHIVRSAEELALHYAGERIHVSDLCLAASVSERTLESAFKEVTGLSPMAYLVRLRLHRVRAALLAAEPGTTLVSTEALKWGFWHFGEFSRAYKQCFGEPPSATLRRGPGVRDLGSNTVAQR